MAAKLRLKDGQFRRVTTGSLTRNRIITQLISQSTGQQKLSATAVRRKDGNRITINLNRKPVTAERARELADLVLSSPKKTG